MALANETLGTSARDFLIYDVKMPVDTKTITVTSGIGILARGTVIAFTEVSPDENGIAWTGAEGQIADCVICDDIDTGTTAGSTVVAHAYRCGHLCRQALIFGEGVTAITPVAEKQLQDAGIYLSNAVM